MSPATPERPPGAALLSSSVRRRMVEHLQRLPRLAPEGFPTRDLGLTAAELGEVLGLHSTTVRFHLDQLATAGLVRAQFVRRGGAGRPAKRYAAVEAEIHRVRHPVAEGPYQVLATLLAGALAPESDPDAQPVTPERAGLEWVRRRMRAEQHVTPEPARTPGQWLGTVGSIVDLLGEWGYTPDLTVDGERGEVRLVLRDCPFLELARSQPEVVCAVHRGLLRGALEAAGHPDAGVILRPLVDARTCHAVLLREGPPPDRTARTAGEHR